MRIDSLHSWRPRLRALILLSEPVLWTAPILVICFAYASTGQFDWLLLAHGLILVCIGDAMINLVNKYTDVVEDAINSPRRIHLINQTGGRTVLLRTSMGLLALILR